MGVSAIFADSASQLEVRQVVGVGVNRETLHTLDKEYRLSLETDRGEGTLGPVILSSVERLSVLFGGCKYYFSPKRILLYGEVFILPYCSVRPLLVI